LALRRDAMNNFVAWLKCSRVYVKIWTDLKIFLQKGDFYDEFGGN